MDFYTKMDMIVVKEEELEEVDVGVGIKQESGDWEITVNKHDIKILNVKEEVESEIEDFEKVFLPEIYKGVTPEIPFFDYIKYKKKYEQNEEIATNVSIVRKNINAFNYPECSEYDEYNLINQDNSRENNNNLKFHIVRTLQSSVQEIEKNKFQGNHFASSRDCKKSQILSRCKNKQKRCIKDVDENCKYKCHLCKRVRGFYTLEAVNNHLKFEHISVFSKSKLKEKKLLIDEGS